MNSLRVISNTLVFLTAFIMYLYVKGEPKKPQKIQTYLYFFPGKLFLLIRNFSVNITWLFQKYITMWICVLKTALYSLKKTVI